MALTKQRKHPRGFDELVRAFGKIHLELKTTYVLKTHAKLPKDIASIVFKMFLEASSAKIRRDIKLIARRTAKAISSPYYSNPLEHLCKLMKEGPMRAKNKALRKLKWMRIVRYTCEKSYFFLESKDRLEFFYTLTIRFCYKLETELSEYFMAQLPRQFRCHLQ